MDLYTVNKIAGAVFATLIGVLVVHMLANAIFPPPAPIAAAPAATSTAAKGGPTPAEAPAAPAEPIGVMLAKASVEKGTSEAKKCASCHTFDKGGANRVGPNLYGIVNRDRASVAGFGYSAAMKAKGGKWTYEELDQYIANPKGSIPGNNMAFAGIASPGGRADLIAYLRTLADSPAPLPQ